MKRYIQNHRLSGLHGFRLIVALLLTSLMAVGNASAGVRVRGNVYGGGNEAPVSGSVEVNMTGGIVNGDVYGGGAKADTNTGNATNYGESNEAITSTSTNTTVVKLNGGTIEGDAYGGGLGVKAVAADPEQGITAVEGVEANVYGDVTVYLGCESVNDIVVATTNVTAFKITNYGSPHADVVKSGRVFGCNNQNGAPKGNVTVNVYKTRKGNVEKTATADLHNESANHTYHVASVYGGGNLANYTAAAGKKTHVNILTCNVSVESVYGGGNAAAVPETDVQVSGAYEIGYVFGGGNGKDPWTLDGNHWTDNAGADVNGNATTLLTGGFIHEAYGASNQKGNIRGSATLRADDAGAEGCALDVVKMVGAGKNADIDGDAILVMGCMPATKIDQVFGGADNANVNGNVELTITSGKFRQVFGGNNLSGMIKGHIKLNIEETGCRPIEIDELYLGGNEAAYSRYGYYNNGTVSAPDYKPRTSEEDHTGQAVENPSNTDGKHPYPYAQPELNIISCTKIGQVFGGGLGSGAVMHASPTLNINMMKGKKEDPDNAGTYIAATELGQVGASFNGVVGGVYGGGKQADVYGKVTVNIGTASSVTLTSGDKQSHTVEGARIVSSVYGGGKDADVIGDTEVNVGAITYNPENYAGVNIAGDVYGGGEGHATTVTGDVTVNVGAEVSSSLTGNGVVSGNVYGGSAFGAVNATKGANYATNSTDIAVTVENEKDKETKVNIYAGTVSGNVFGGGLGQKNGLNGATSDIAAQNFGDATVTMKGGTVSTAVYGGANVNGTLKANSTVKIIGGTVNAVPGEGESLTDVVFGGGLGENTSVVGNVVVNIGNYDADAETNNVTGNATINGHVYGGSAKGSVNNADENNAEATKTKHTHVNLYAGTVTGDVYGGGLGTADVAAQGEQEAVTGIAAIVYGDVVVKLNEQAGSTAKVGGSVFGCNNLKGTPKGNVTVDVYETYDTGTKPTKFADYLSVDDEDLESHGFELAGVFGGGNLAAYAPTEGNGTTVTIRGCGTSSIKEVYGGGNAASVPNCVVNIYGAYEIGYVYGGGKGTADAAANVTGNATTIINGGTIYRTFGGSNTNGDILGTSTLTIEEGANTEGANTENECKPKLGDVFSYGNKATMSKKAVVTMGCLTYKVGALYGGAMNANINNDIELNVKGGTYAKVFGGNKTGGSINGSITVNIEEEDPNCGINIDDLYGCGNEAPYSIYGTEKNSSDQWVVKTENTAAGFPKADPQINLRSFTSIGNVYGAGLGESAVVLGTPTINVNVIKAANDYTLGNVYGGGSMASVTGSTIINIGTTATVTMATVEDNPSTDVNEHTPAVASAAISGNVFGGGYGHETTVSGTATINIGERSGSEGSYTYTDHGVSFNNTSHIYGGSALGTVATTEVNLFAGTVAANVFGGGKGRLASGTEGGNDYVEAQGATVTTANVNLYTATVTGNIYGGCDDNGTTTTAVLNLTGGTVGSSETTPVPDKVFGGGRGHFTTTTTATVNAGSQTTSGTPPTTTYAGTSYIYSNVYGGSALGAVGTAIVNLNSVTTLTGHVFGGGMGEGTAEATKATITTSATVNQNGVTLAADKDIYGGCNVNGTAAATFVYLMAGSVHDVFGGGLGQHTGVTGNVLVEIGHYDSSTDALTGTATVTNDVYGGSAKGAVNSDTENTTTVNLWKGTVNGDVYGGGLGVKSETPAENILAVVNGNVRVNLNGYDSGTETITPVSKGECVVKGSIFGGNNAKGSPAGTSEVHIYKTVGWTDNHGTPNDDRDDISHMRTDLVNLPSTTASDHHYELLAVYGGGNLAAFTGTTTNVVIETCDPSIESVYGGGNAADAANTSVLVKGAYEIGTVFGGGNGQVSAANVPGTATTVLNGGLIHDFYGGSNTAGTIGTYDSEHKTTSGGPVITINDLQIGTDCSLKFDNIYGAGKSANVDGNISMTMGCLSDQFTVQNLYGGAQAADVRGDVTLTVTSGRFDRVFGGNNQSGTIGGNITVNLEETGCKPLIIGQVFGGGNQANFDHNTTVNAKSFTSIGEIYGGGNLANVAGSTSVNILTKESTMNGSDESVFAGETIAIEGKSVVLPAHAKKTVGSIGYVYGGGFGANTNVGQNVEVTIGSTSDTNIKPVITGDVYGGSALGTVNGTTPTTDYHTYVTLNKGCTVSGNIYGGGLGQKNGVNGATSDVEATVNGAVTVTVNGGKAANVFGCNNLNGSPQSTVAIYVNGTDGVSVGTSAIGNVYGGGNQAQYTYTGATPLLVEINGGTTYQTCTIGNVYGGGLSADVAGSITVNIKGGKVLGDVYGGGALAHTNTANWDPNKNEVSGNHELGEWKYVDVTSDLRETTFYESKGFVTAGKSVNGYYVLNDNKQYVVTSDETATGTTEYFVQHIGKIVAGYYTTDAQNHYVPVSSDEAEENNNYYKRQIVGDWASGKNDSSTGTTYKTTVNLTGGVVGNVYGGGLGDLTELGTGHSNVSAIVYGDVTVTLGNGTHATGFVQEVETPEDSENAVPVSGRVFGCNNINGTPLGNVTVTVNNTQQTDANEQPISGHSDNKFDVHSVYGGGNLSRYEPASDKEEKVLIYGCDKTSIEKAFGGGNSAAVPKTTVVIYGSHRIGYVFGGGNGADMIKKGTSWEENDGAPVYGDATVIAVGGKIGMTFAGSDTKGTVWGNATTKLKGTDNLDGYTSPDNCELKITNSYGAGRGADINSDVNFIITGCTSSQIETVFGGSYDANIRGNINLTITGGVYTQVFGGNDHGGKIGGNITVNIEESETCNPTIIQYLYGGCREAAYPGNGAINSAGTSVTRGKITVNVKSATRIDNVYGGGWRALVNGDTEVNINMIKGSWAGASFTLPTGYRGNPIPNSNMTVRYDAIPAGDITVGTTPVLGWYTYDEDTHTYIQITDQDKTADANVTYYIAIPNGAIQIKDEIGTIGNVYGGSYQSETNGNATVNIGTVARIDILKREDEVDGDGGTNDVLVHPGADIVDANNQSVYVNNVLTGTLAYVKKPVLGAHITGSVYGGGDLANMEKYQTGTAQTGTDDHDDPIMSPTYMANTGNTFVNVCAVETSANSGVFNAVSNGTVSIEGSVYGGGRGIADNFQCAQGMVNGDAGTTVRIGNGTVEGSVYGGGEVARVETNSHVTVGLTPASGVTESAPVIEGSVFGGGKGVSTHGYSALLRGDTHVIIDKNTKVKQSVYGGGEIASVGRYNVAKTQKEADDHGVEIGMPYSLANVTSGKCYVTVQGDAVIGPDAAMHMNAANGPDFLGNVFGAGKGVLPYEGYAANEDPWRMDPNDDKETYSRSTDEVAYLKFVETLALATEGNVTIGGNAFIKGSVYGGSENGVVQHNTHVIIEGGQIGCGKNTTERHPSSVWDIVTPADNNGDYECDSWPYTSPYAPYDEYAGTSGYNANRGATTGSDGHTFYGNVFGGGSGRSPYAPGKWHRKAGAVGGNTKVDITGGHILTNVYGGNELTSVGTYNSSGQMVPNVDAEGHEIVDPYFGSVTGKCVVNFGGTATLGVPRTLTQIKNHPVTCYLFGAGKGDQRSTFETMTNVNEVKVNITGGWIYGSIFGGGEDGHVMHDVDINISDNTSEASHTNTKIGTWGTSYVDGNVFGGGRGYSGEDLVAGAVAGKVDIDISGGTMLGSIYGGGRLGSVGLDLSTSINYATGVVTKGENFGKLKTTGTDGEITINISGGTIGNTHEYQYYTFSVENTDTKTVKQIDDAKKAEVATLNAGLTTANIPNTEFEAADSVQSGTTRTYTYRLKHTKGGNVYAGGMGRITKLDNTSVLNDWYKLGKVKSTKLTISEANESVPTVIKSNVYGGGELGWVTGTHRDANDEKDVATEIVITGGTIGTEVKDDGSNVKYTFGSVFGGGFGSTIEKLYDDDNPNTIDDNPKFKAGRVVHDTKVDMQNGTVLASVYGGGEMANVGQFYNFGEGTVISNTHVSVSGGTIGKNKEGTGASTVYYGGAKMGNVYGGGSGDRDIVRSGLISGNTYVTISGTPTIYHNIYGGGAYGTVGDFEYEEAVDPNYQNAIKVKGVNKLHTTGTGVANVTITGGTIGTDGHNNGMVFGSSRGDVIGGYIRDNYLAWVYDTHVTIGETGGDTSTPLISGSVYGSGENGHTFRNTYVTVHSGKIGLTTVQNTDPEDETKQGANYPQRGNVYGAGCGTDTYTGTDGKEHFEEMAGIVQGNATVVVDGGLVVHNVYGGGSMGSVGTIDDTKTVWHKSGNSTATNPTLGDHDTFYDFGLSWPVKFEYKSNAAIEANDQVTGVTGVASVTITGSATIGVEDSKGGHVFGATRGDVEVGQADITDQRYEEAKFANVRKSEVIIGTKDGTATTPTIWGSVYGGGEDGHVYEDASVTIYHGTIAHNVFGGGKGEGQYTTTLYAIDPDHPNDNTKHIELDDQNVYSWTAGRVYGNTTVTMNGGSVGYFIYGGGNLGSVGKGNYAGGADDYSTVGYGELPSKDGSLWTATTGFNPDAPITSENQPSTMADYFLSSGKATVNIFGGSVGTASGADNAGIPYGSVFGGSRGKAAASCKRSPRYRYVPDFFLGYVNKAIINIGGTAVDALSSGSPTIHGSVYGGGQDGHVRNSTEVHIYKGSVVGKDDDEFGRSGHVFGAGSGIGTYDDGGVAKVNNSSGSVTCTSLVEVNGSDAYIVGNIYGGGALASVGPPKTGGVNQTYDEKNTPSGDWKSYSYSQVSIKAGTIGGNVFAASRGAGDSYLATNPHFDTDNGKYDATKYATDIWSNVHVSGGKIGYDSNGDVVADGGSVYGGGEAGQVKCGVTVNITGGEIAKDVYGGGALANTNTSNLKQDKLDNNKWKWTDAAKTAKYTTTVNLLGGTIHGDAYGGGLGRKEFGTEGQEGYVSPVEALAYGNVIVELNNGVNINQRGCVVSRIFGCNNLNGSPQGHVKVHVHATQPAGEGKTIKAADKFAKFKKRSEYATTNYSELTTLATTVGINTEEAPFSTYLSTLSSGTDNEKKTALENMIEAIAKKKYDVLAVYGGGNLAAYTPMGPDALPGTDTDINNITTDYLNTEENTEVIIDGCELTSIKQVYGGGNAASTPANYVVVNGSYEIDEVFGGGNGADNYKLKEGSPTADVWYQNPGANVGYRNYTHYVKPGSTDPVYNSTTHGTGAEATPYLAITDAGADAEGDEGKAYRQAHYLYGTGVATTDIKGGKMHAVYGGSNKKGNISNTALSMYQGASDCVLDVDEAYGAGKNAPIDGKVDQRLKCAHGIKEMFGGAMNADVDNDINLTITNGSSLERVFGGNNTSGAINGTITVTIEEGGCEPIRIGELYAGGYLAPYSIYGYETNSDGSYKTENVSYIDKDGTTKSLAQRIPLTSGTARRDPIINVVSATYIGEIFGGGYQAKLVGNPRVNVNMTNGFVEVTKTEKTNSDPDTEDAFTEGEGENAKTYLYKDDAGNIYAPANVNNNLEVTLPIGTIGNIYGGGNLADVIGDTFVEIGTGEWTNKEGKREMDGTIQLNSQDFTSTFTYDETSKKWTYEKATTLSGSSIIPVEGSTIEGTVTVNEETINAAFTYISGNWTYGNENTIVAFDDITPMDRSTIQGTTSTITTATTFTYDATKVQWSYTAPEPINGTPTPTRNAATITDNVYGGGKGKADNYECDKAMIGEVNSDRGSTSVIIANGTVGTIEDGKLKDGTGNVYGGGKIGRVEANTEVTIGAEGVVTGNVFAPVIEGNVFGAGQGVATHGYSGLTRGHSTVTIQGKAKVRRSVYGGGEMATVGRFWVKNINDASFADKNNEKYAHVPTGMPYALMKGGECSVTVKDDAEIGTDNMKMLHLDNTGNVVNGEDGTPLPPDDWGHVFGAGKGVLPYENVGTDGPKRMIPDGSWESYVGKDTEYLKYIETLALANNTKVTIEGNAFIKGSVYGGSENGRVLNDTHVTIQDNCQIGCGVDKTEPYSEALWTQAKNAVTAEEIATIAELMPECASWPYGKNIGTEQNPQMIYAPYDRLALSTPGHEEEYDAKDEDDHPISTEGGRRIASDGHTFYGNVFGGGSGLYPYKPGKWHRQAGSVGGNTVVNITGGHILTSVYGGNEQTDVGTYTKDAYFNDPIIPKSGGKSTVNMVGGTLGVPRTLNQIKNHPVTCYLFGAGKGDQRIFFNTWTNVTETEVNVTGTARIFGSVFGGGEDGHIINDAKTTIGGSVSIDLNGDGDKTDEGETFTAQNGLKIGTWGTSYVDGNVFGAGRGFSGEALTAGSVGGNVLVNIAGGTMLGSVYGGGRLASVGTFFSSTTNPYYGQLQEDIEAVAEDVHYTAEEIANAQEGDDAYGKTTDDIKIPAHEASTHGHITINISGGTIGNDLENITVEHTKGGNVFGGSMGRIKLLDDQTTNPLWPKMGTVKTTKINIYGVALIKGNVYGGGEYSMTRGDTHVTIGGILGDDNVTITSTESDAPTIKRDVFGGGYGSDDFTTKTEITAGGFDANKYTFTPMQLAGIVCGDTYVNIKRGHVQKNVYGGGELATVGLIDFNGAEQHKDIRNPGTSDEKIYGFGLSWPYKMDFIPYMPDGTGPIGGTTNINVSGGRLGITGKDVLIDGGDKIDNGDIYGGSKGKAGDRYDMGFCGNVKATNITIDYPSSNGAKPENYKTDPTLPCVTGAVYGGGEDGHVIEDTHVTLKNGLVGHAIYGGGSGKGKYTQKLYDIGSTTSTHNADIYSITSGKVYGNTHVKMEGGYVVRFVYGGGNMGSVGKGNYSSGPDDYYPDGYGETLIGSGNNLWTSSCIDATHDLGNPKLPLDTAYYFLSSGKTEVEILGGKIGYVNTEDPTESMKDGLPYGCVFGGSRGESAPNIRVSPRYHYSPEFFSGYVNETKVTIGGYRCKKACTDKDDKSYTVGMTITAEELKKAFAGVSGMIGTDGKPNATYWELIGPVINGSVFGGGQDGHVRRDTHVIVDAGEIGLAYNSTNQDILGTNLDNPQWLHRGNVYGAGSGIGEYTSTLKYADDYSGVRVPTTGYSTSAGSVTRYTQVDINGGTIHRNVYGGGSLASVGPLKINQAEEPYKKDLTNTATLGKQSQCTVNIGGAGKVAIGTPDEYQAHYGGEVYGASRGDLSIGEDFGVTVWTQVFIKDGAHIMGNVFGGGDNGKVKMDTDVQIGEPATSSTTTP